MKKQQGFTLIELLVVIAIIGILSAVVLASLNTARSKGNDAAVKANLASVATQAALYVTDHSNSYGTFAGADCPTPSTASATVFGDGTIQNAIAAALVASSGGTTRCASNNTAYVVSVSRPADVASTTSNCWCVDSTGLHCGINDPPTGNSCGSCITSQ